MPVNRFFNHTTFRTEQNLIEDLIIESIQIYGHMAYYIPREDQAIDTILGEDGLSKYITAYPLEVFLSTFDSFAGQSEFVSKFGLQIEDQAKFLIASKRFFEATESNLQRPRENDLIFIEFSPDNRFLFEIRFVENKEKLFQLGKLYTYELRCELMNFSHERIQTGLDEVDQVTDAKTYVLSINLASGNGDYLKGETVYQGDSFVTALGTGTVVLSNSSILQVSDITGEFEANTQIVGVISNATWLPVSAPNTKPTVHDSISDNAQLKTEHESFIVNRGTNPITGFGG